MREGTIFAKGKIYPRWNPDSQDRLSTALPLIQRISTANGLPFKQTVNRYNESRMGSPSRGPHGKLAFVTRKPSPRHIHADVQRAVMDHPRPARELPPHERIHSHDMHICARSYYDDINFGEEGACAGDHDLWL